MYRLIGGSDPSRVMVDVGACVGSALRPFAHEQWEVHAFEPDARNRAELLDAWGAAPQVTVDARALGSEPSVGLPFYSSDVSKGISSLTPFHESHAHSGTVDVTTLGEYRREHELGDIGFLKIDTEGFDLFVLEGNDWSMPKPRVILCEFEDGKTMPLGYGMHDLAGFLSDHGYSIIVSEWYPVVEYGATHRWRRFWRYPGEVSDPDAWGNLMAVRDASDAEAIEAILPRTATAWRFGSALRALARR